jgi:carbon storage regulator CsrA
MQRLAVSSHTPASPRRAASTDGRPAFAGRLLTLAGQLQEGSALPKLQLARHVNESIAIGDDITIVIKRVKGHVRPVVTVEIEAPQHVKILRSELTPSRGEK